MLIQAWGLVGSNASLLEDGRYVTLRGKLWPKLTSGLALGVTAIWESPFQLGTCPTRKMVMFTAAMLIYMFLDFQAQFGVASVASVGTSPRPRLQASPHQTQLL